MNRKIAIFVTHKLTITTGQRTEFEEADKLFFAQIEAELLEDETLQTKAKVNKLDTFKFAFDDKFIGRTG